MKWLPLVQPQVIDPLQRGAGIVEQVVTVCVPIKISHRVDPERSARWWIPEAVITLDTELLDQISLPDHVEVIVVAMIGRGPVAKFVHQRW